MVTDQLPDKTKYIINIQHWPTNLLSLLPRYPYMVFGEGPTSNRTTTTTSKSDLSGLLQLPTVSYGTTTWTILVKALIRQLPASWRSLLLALPASDSMAFQGPVTFLNKCEITLGTSNTQVLKPFSFDRTFWILKLTDLDLYAYGLIWQGILRMNYAWKPFKAKVRVKLIHIFLRCLYVALLPGSFKNLNCLSAYKRAVWLYWSMIITWTTTLMKFWRLYTIARL